MTDIDPRQPGAEMYHESPPPLPASPVPGGLPVVLLSPYELGRQPFGVAEPAAWLARRGFPVTCIDLSRQMLDETALRAAGLVAIHLPMHTAARIAAEALPRIKALAPAAHILVFGLYATVNADYFRGLGAHSVLGGEVEPDLEALALALAAGPAPGGAAPREAHHRSLAREALSRRKVRFLVPDRSGLPPLEGYASLVLPDGTERVIGFAEASRGCKHLCRHCPIVPVYDGRFRIVDLPVVLADVRNQVEAGARHISFGDPDFLNGPTHALRVVEAIHAEMPALTYDATIKIEHLLAHEALLPKLAETGCLFITSAVESVDDAILEKLAKNHRAADLPRALAALERLGIALAPTFVSFTPWTTLTGYRDLLRTLVELGLVESVPPIQLAIRLLVPAESRLLELPGFEALVGSFDPVLLGYPWEHPDPRVDDLHARVRDIVTAAEGSGETRRRTFARIWEAAHASLGSRAPELPESLGRAIPHHSEPWYCCAEPTEQQLRSF